MNDPLFFICMVVIAFLVLENASKGYWWPAVIILCVFFSLYFDPFTMIGVGFLAAALITMMLAFFFLTRQLEKRRKK